MDHLSADQTAGEGPHRFESPHAHRARAMYNLWMKNKEVQQRKLRLESRKQEKANGRHLRVRTADTRTRLFQMRHDQLEQQYMTLSQSNQRFLRDYLSFHTRTQGETVVHSPLTTLTEYSSALKNWMDPGFNLFSPLGWDQRRATLPGGCMTSPCVKRRRFQPLSLSRDIADKIRGYEEKRKVLASETQLPSQRTIMIDRKLIMTGQPKAASPNTVRRNLSRKFAETVASRRGGSAVKPKTAAIPGQTRQKVAQSQHKNFIMISMQ